MKTYNIITRATVVTALIVFSVCPKLVADSKADAVVARVGSILKEYSDYRVKFTVVYDGIDDIKGEYTVSRDRYSIKIDDQYQFSDGKVRYEVYEPDREIVIDKADLSSSNILTNPTRAFEFAPGQFNTSYGGEVTRNGAKAHKIVLTPVKNMPGVSKITLYVATHNELPVAIEYDYDGETIKINIDSVEKLAGVNESLFKYNSADYKDYDIIDFR